MTNGINEFLDAAGQAVKIFPKLYEDGLQSTVQETGKIITRIPKAINAAFSPLDKWVENKLYNVEETKKLLAKKLENVNPDKIVTPESYVAVPAIQAIAYSMNSEELRNLYANLLAKSMQVDTKNSVHPSFVEIIKQLSPMDANVLELLSKNMTDINDTYPIVRIYSMNDSRILKLYKQNILSPKYKITRENLNSFELSLDNLVRLNLISIDYNTPVAEEYLYNEIDSIPLINDLKNEIKSQADSEYRNHFIEHGSIWFSPFGNSFIQTCLN